jgi:chorismate mutase
MIPEELHELRQRLDAIDAGIVRLLASRFAVTRQVGAVKKRHRLDPTDESRERTQFKRLDALFQEYDLNPELAHKLWRLIMDEVVREHRQMRD